MNTPNRKRPSDNTEEERTSGFLFDDSFETCIGGVLLEDEDRPSATTAQLQPVSDLERRIVEEKELLSDPTMNCEIDPEPPTTLPCFAAPSRHPTAIDHPAASVSLIEQQQFLQAIFDGVSNRFHELSFTMACNGNSGAPVLTITHKHLFSHPPLGLISRIQVTIEYKKYSVFVLLRLWRMGEVKDIDDAYEICWYVSSLSGYKFCPGIDPDYYEEEYHRVLRFHVKSVRLCYFPFSRVDSVNCMLWFKPALNLSTAEKAAREVKCPPCKCLVHDLNWQKTKTGAESPARKIKRQDPSSRARLQYMSPLSQQKRKMYAQYQRKSNIRKLKKYEASELVLDDEQNAEMCSVMEATQPDELEKLFKEGDEHGVGSLMKSIWYTDRDRQKTDFCHDQDHNKQGGRGNKWNMITIRMALAVYVRSPAAYKALESFGILKLPSKSTIQAYTGAFMHEPGASSVCIADQVARYVIFVEECRKAGKQEPRADGVLIFDEVKVACQLLWNSRSHQLMGLAMTPGDLSSLNDIYKVLQDPGNSMQTSYILQFLWRDLTSSYDIVGPYFTSSTSVENKFVTACIFETIKLFQYHGLRTSLLICDGGSANVSVIKASHGCHGAYSLNKDAKDIFEIQPWIKNPFNPPNKIFWMICPSHQLKNMINALFSSKDKGTKQFQRGKGSVLFGWKTITDLYKRELTRVSNGQARMVPRLREAHCLRDSWTKLNVLPAKIMQQEQVLGELHWYIHQDPPPADAQSTLETVAYLEACHLLFEEGFLSHNQIRCVDSQILKNICKGYQYFSAWLMSLLDEDAKYPHTSATQRSFLSWQTWDLLRIDVYGFKAFCQWFLTTYPTYFVSPLRLSGSAVESLFSQYKYSAGGKLDSVNYTTSRAAHLIKQCTADHHSGLSYRDEDLKFAELPLQKTQYNKHT